jgi:hypothetical protein
METSVEASTGQIAVRYKDKDGKEKVLKEQRAASRCREWIVVYPGKAHPTKGATNYSIHGCDHPKTPHHPQRFFSAEIQNNTNR